MSGHSSVGRAFDCSGKLYWIQYGFRNQMATGSIPVDRTHFFTLSSPSHLTLLFRPLSSSLHVPTCRLITFTYTYNNFTLLTLFPYHTNKSTRFYQHSRGRSHHCSVLIISCARHMGCTPKDITFKRNHIRIHTLSCQYFCCSCSLR